MNDNLPGPMHVDKEDRYVTDEASSVRKKSQPSKFSGLPLVDLVKHLNKRIIIAVLILFVLILLISFIFGGSSDKTAPTENADWKSVSPNSSVSSPNSAINNGQATPQEVTPPDISREATQTQPSVNKPQERVEIPGSVTDQISEKINSLDSQAAQTPAAAGANSAVHNNSANRNAPQTSQSASAPTTAKPVQPSQPSSARPTNSHNGNTVGIQMDSQKPGKLDSTSKEQLLAQSIDKSHYTIQLSGSSSLENLMAYAKQNQITNFQIYETRRDNKPWFNLIKGNYPSADDAKAAIKGLPDAVQKNKPWIKSGAAVQKEKQLR